MSDLDKPFSKDNPYSKDLTCDWQGFCNLWLIMAAHLNTYGHPPHYRKTARFLAAGGFWGFATGQFSEADITDDP